MLIQNWCCYFLIFYDDVQWQVIQFESSTYANINVFKCLVHNIMQRQQNLKKYLQHLYSISSQKLPQLLKLFVKVGTEYAQTNDQAGFIRIIRAEINKNKGARCKELIRIIYIFDSIIKELKVFRQPVSQVIGQIFVQLFSIFFENNFQSQIEEMKMIRKSWATLLPDNILDKIQKDILTSYNFNLDKGFSKKKIDQLTNYYTTKIKLPPQIYNSKTNDTVQQFSSESGEQPVKRRVPQPTVPQTNTFPAPSRQVTTPTSYSMPPSQNYQSNYPPNPYPNQSNSHYMYPNMPSAQYPQMQHQMGMKNPYYYSGNMPMHMNGYNSYYNGPQMGMYGGMNNMGGIDYKMNPYYYAPQVQTENKSKQRQEIKKPKQRMNMKYKELISFGRYRCPCCGMVSNRRDYFDMHLKSHFQQSKQDYERLKKQTPIRRSPGLDSEQWMPLQIQDNQMRYFVEMNKSTENYCRLCSNTFSPSWDSTLQKWVYSDVVLVKLDDNKKCSMHFNCFNTLNEDGTSNQ